MKFARKNLGRKTRQIETVTYVIVQNHVNLTRYFFNFFKIGRTLPLPYLLRRRRIPKEHKRLIKQRPKTTIQTMTLIPNIEDDALLDNKNSPQSLPNPECHLHLLVLLEHIFHNRNRNTNNSNNIRQRNSR